ncbi:MAG: GGDEF domain-containing protein [Acidimicrobiia bacterium]|nr:GGDEF domain-containing protein [Acidimicrobiia bacterium]
MNGGPSPDAPAGADQPPPTVAGFDTRLVAELRDPFGVLGPDGRVAWANQALATLLDMPLGDLLGRAALDMIHPDEVGQAVDGLSHAVSFPDRTAVVPYRLRRGDGTYVTTELMSSIVGNGTHMALLVRDGSTRQCIADALASVAHDTPLDTTAASIAKAVTTRWPKTHAAVLWFERDGRRVCTTDGLPDDLAALLGPSSTPEDSTAVFPWDLAMRTGEQTITSRGDTPEPLGDRLHRHGLGAVACAPVADSNGDGAAVVAFFDQPEVARLEFTWGSTELCELLLLALDRHHHHRQVAHAARHDELTGLLNRSGFLEALDDALADRHGGQRRPVGLLFIDLDGFKPVNDAHGHLAGDRVLQAVAQRLLGLAASAVAEVGRLGGDEFALLVLPEPTATTASTATAATVDATAAELAQHVVAVLGEAIVVEDPMRPGARLEVHIGGSVGLAVSGGSESATELLAAADRAMYAAKAAGRGRWHLHATA